MYIKENIPKNMAKKYTHRKPKDMTKIYKRLHKRRLKESVITNFKKRIKKYKTEHQIKDNPYYKTKKDQLETLAMDATGSAKVVCSECQCDITKFPKVIIPTKQKEESATENITSNIITIEKSNPIPIIKPKIEKPYSIICLKCLLQRIKYKKIFKNSLKNKRRLEAKKKEVGLVKTKNKDKFSYYIIDRMEMSLFTQNWTLEQELKLLNGIEKLGLDNWDNISQAANKGSVECESHYYTFYYKNQIEIMPNENEVILHEKNNTDNNTSENYIENYPSYTINLKQANANKKKEDIYKMFAEKHQGMLPETPSNSNGNHYINRGRSIKQRNHKKNEQNSKKTSVSEILGYWPKREEFDIEYLNDAELELSELEFKDNDTKEEFEKKKKILEIYNRELDERAKRKKFVIERNLFDLKKQIGFEKKLSKEDRDIYSCLKQFQRFYTQEQFLEIFEGHVFEKNLKHRLNQLNYYKNLGCKTYEDIQKYIELEEKKNYSGTSIRKKTATLPNNNNNSQSLNGNNNNILSGNNVSTIY